MTTNEILRIALALLAFLVTREIVRRIANSASHGILNEFYLRYIHPKLMDNAYEKEDAKLIDEQEYKAKLAQLSARTYANRETAIAFFDHVPPTQKLADKLSHILPLQHRRDTQMRMACLLCRTLTYLEKSKQDLAKPQTAAVPGLENKADWSVILGIWATEAALVALFWTELYQLSIGQIVAISAAIFLLAFLPLIGIIHDLGLAIKIVAIFLALTLASVWGVSEYVHTGIDSKVYPADAFGFSGVTLEIAYPKWLTADDVGRCTKAITVLVFGDSSTQTPKQLELSFGYDHATLFTSDKACSVISPRFLLSTANPAGEPIELWIRPQDQKLLSSKSIVTITPQIRDPAQSGPPAPINELILVIQLEDPAWKTMRDICRIGTGITSIPTFLWFVLEWLRKKG